MKRIKEYCDKNAGGKENDLKLRLRGRGSGYKEGPLLKESDEPLHLCISTSSLQKFELAQVEVETLLKGIYSQYAKHTKTSPL
jgi:hypothetical protein